MAHILQSKFLEGLSILHILGADVSRICAGYKALGRATPACTKYPPSGDSGGYDATLGNRTAAQRSGYQDGARCEPFFCECVCVCCVCVLCVLCVCVFVVCVCVFVRGANFAEFLYVYTGVSPSRAEASPPLKTRE